MTPASELPQIVRDALVRLATAGDRDSPTVFAGREDEFRLLDNAVDRVREGRRGLTVVIEGVPGAGKTALLNEYATRLLAANADAERPVIPVPLNAGTLNMSPAAIVEEIDRRFRELAALGASKKWDRMANRAVGGAALLGNALFAAVTRRNIQEFTPSARAPESLPIALEDYVDFRFGRRKNTLVFLVDEAQNLHDTLRVRDYLEVLHKREYYAARLQPRSHHTMALAHAFAGAGECWTPMDNVMAALMASDDRGRPVDEETALAVIDGLCATGFIEQGVGSLRPLLPSLSSHFQAVQQSAAPDNKVVRAVRAACAPKA